MAPEDAAASAQADTIRIGIASIAGVGVSNVTVSGDPTLAGRYASCIAQTAPNSELIKRR